MRSAFFNTLTLVILVTSMLTNTAMIKAGVSFTNDVKMPRTSVIINARFSRLRNSTNIIIARYLSAQNVASYYNKSIFI